MARLLILSGPSCVGKGPLLAALRRCAPLLEWAQPVLHASRAPRPGERDGVEFWFRDAATIQAYDPERHLVVPMRNQWRAIDLLDLEQLLAQHQRVVVEFNPLNVERFLGHPRVAGWAQHHELVSVLLQPLSPAEAADLARFTGRPVESCVADVMRVKQIERARRMGMLLDAAQLADIDVRASAAWVELTHTTPFDVVLVNHDAEGSDHWLFSPPIGDAGATYRALLALLAQDLGDAT